MLAHSAPAAARALLEQAQEDVALRWRLYEYWASMPFRARVPGEASGSGTKQEGHP